MDESRPKSTELTCFVISPIGESGTAVRKSADDFYDLIVKPSLEKFGFIPLRSDKISGPGSISEDILRHVQESDLCIVDLTGHNPNVFYECGRRHEAGRPCIQLIEASESIPFDLSGIRTLKYRLSNPRSVRDTVVEVQSFIEEITKSGFSDSSTGASMSAIAEMLKRIDRRIADLETVRQSPQNDSSMSLLTSPLRAMQEAIVQGDLTTLVELLPRIENTLGINHNAVIQTAVVVAVNGIAEGASALKRILGGNRVKLKPRPFMAAVSGLVQYFVARDEEKEGCDYLIPIVRKYLEEIEVLDDSKSAYLHNQLSILQHGAGDYKGSLDSLSTALKLAPKDRSYWYNLSVTYESLERVSESCDAAKKSIEGQDMPDVDHLAHAIEVFTKASKTGDAEAAMATLARVDPARARFVERIAEVPG